MRAPKPQPARTNAPTGPSRPGAARKPLQVPLRQLRPAQQETLSETLLCWLQSGGNAREVARRLHVHPQTARYRMRQLTLLFGEELHEPDTRFELEIALRAQQLPGLNGKPPGNSSQPASKPPPSPPGKPPQRASKPPQPAGKPPP